MPGIIKPIQMVSVQCLNILWSAHWHHPSLSDMFSLYVLWPYRILWYICQTNGYFKLWHWISVNGSMCTISWVYSGCFIVLWCVFVRNVQLHVPSCAPLSLCPSYCLWAWDFHCVDVAVMVSVCQFYLSFYFGDEFMFQFCLCYHFIQHCFGKKSFRECCPPLPLLPETSNNTSVIHTFHSTHLHSTNTTNASQVLQTLQKKNLQLAFHSRLWWGRDFTSTTQKRNQDETSEVSQTTGRDPNPEIQTGWAHSAGVGCIKDATKPY